MPFAANFQPARGDVIYGFTEQRDHYIQDYLLTPYATPAVIQAMSNAWIRIDDYNNATFADLPAPGYDSKSDMNARVPTEIDNDRNVLSNDATGSRDRTQAQKLQAQAYWNAIRQHRDYRPSTVFDKSAAAIAAKEDIPVALFDGAENRRQNTKWAMIRKGCKFGLEYITTVLPGDAKVHFVLDNIDMNRVVDHLAKEPRMAGLASAKPITYSELRFAYRSWERLKLAIKFYLNGNEVDAPWVADPKLWLVYEKSRLQKYKDAASPRLSSNQMTRNTSENIKTFEDMLRRAEDAERQGKWEQALDSYKEVTAFAKRLNR